MELHPRMATDRRRAVDRRKARDRNYLGPERRSGLDRRSMAREMDAMRFQGRLESVQAFPMDAGEARIHRIIPRNGNRFHSPLLVVKRLQTEFAYVEADEAVGRRHVTAMIKELESEIGGRANSIHRRRLEYLSQVKDRAVYVHFGDDPGSETEYLCTVVIPGEPLVFEYESIAHQRAVRSLLARCAQILEYDIAADGAEELSGHQPACVQH